MKQIVLAFSLFGLIGLISLPVGAGTAGDEGYRTLIARHCRAVPYDKADRYFRGPWTMARSTIRIRSVRPLGGGWLRITGTASVWSRFVWGHMDYNPRTGRVICPLGNWEVNPSLEILPLFLRR
ncbi:MAG TPA: hypothetical protein ENK41_01575 [Rhodobacteraceae bacterium]|nr:hypothetical protein [Paracoccaceae bacterium]